MKKTEYFQDHFQLKPMQVPCSITWYIYIL